MAQKPSGKKGPLLSSPSRLAQQQAERIALLEHELQKMRHFGMIDPVTGLLNEHGFAVAFTAEQDRIARRASCGGLVVMIELDSHASLEHRLGTQAGHAALLLMSQAIRSRIRPMDSAARIGIDEFAVLLCHTTSDEALSRVQRLSLDLNKISLDWQGSPFFIGASIGVRPVGIRETLSDVLMHADADVYAKKRAAGQTPYRLVDKQKKDPPPDINTTPL